MKRLVCTPIGVSLWKQYAQICSSMTAGGEEGWLYLLPTRQLLNSAKRMIEQGEGFVGYSRMNLLTLDDLVRMVLERAGVNFHPLQSGDDLTILVKVLQDLGDQNRLKHYLPQGDPWSYGDGLLQAIAELKRYLIHPGQLGQAVDKLDLSAKEKELAIIYQYYQEQIRQTALWGQDDQYIEATRLIKEQGQVLLSGFHRLYLNDYFEFTPVKWDFVQQVIGTIPRVEINITYDINCPEAYPLTGATLKRFQQLPLEVVHKEDDERHWGRTLVHSIFAKESGGTEAKDKVVITSYPRWEEEIRGMGREIKRLIVLEGYSPEEICIVPRTVEQYKQAIIRLFREYGLPLDSQEEVPLSSHPLVRDLVVLCGMKGNDLDREQVLKIAYSPYLGRGLGLDGKLLSQRLTSHFVCSRDDWERLAEEEEIDGIHRLFHLLDELPEICSYQGFCQSVLQVINSIPLEEEIIKLNLAGGKGDGLEGLRQDLSVLNRLKELVSYSPAMIQDCFETLTIRQWTDLLHRRLQGIKVTKRKGDKGGVQLLEPSALRGLDFSVVFMPGLEEGIFPRYPQGNWVLPEELRRKLKGEGLLLSGRIEQQQAEQFFFTLALATARDKVYLSHSTGREGEGRLGSWLLDEVMGVLGQESLSNDLVNSPNWTLAPSVQELMGSLCLSLGKEQQNVLSQLEEGRNLPKAFFSRVWAERSRWEIDGKSFTPYTGNLEQSAITTLLADLFHEGTTYSAGQFKEYGACPFRFFAKRVLGLGVEEELTGEIQGLDRGNMYHEVLARFMANIPEGRLDPAHKQRYRNQLSAIFDQVVENGFIVLTRSPRWTGVKQLMKRDLERWLEFEVEQQQNNPSFRPSYLEWSFGLPLKGDEDPGSTLNPLLIKGEGKTIKIGGRIDRIDRSSQGLYDALDYKTSSFPSYNELGSMVELQIPIYLLAIQQLLCSQEEQVVSGGYYSLRSGKRGGGIWLSQYTENLTYRKGKKGKLTQEEWDIYLEQVQDKLLEYVNNIQRGRFYVFPKECSPYCEYKDVCRFDPLQWAELGGEE